MRVEIDGGVPDGSIAVAEDASYEALGVDGRPVLLRVLLEAGVVMPPQVPLKLVLVRVGELAADIAREEAATSHLLRAGRLGEVKLLVLKEKKENITSSHPARNQLILIYRRLYLKKVDAVPGLNMRVDHVRERGHLFIADGASVALYTD